MWKIQRGGGGKVHGFRVEDILTELKSAFKKSKVIESKVPMMFYGDLWSLGRGGRKVGVWKRKKKKQSDYYCSGKCDGAISGRGPAFGGQKTTGIMSGFCGPKKRSRSVEREGEKAGFLLSASSGLLW